ncbi:hypothetical protein FSP39_013361 [Pinctada imbricata]|uniref:Uncharacterized protein n=1 Tax=Pinctada imbricata TaxID=66713 RepID=A0AA88YD91_PINIB|nr:hypothetical protein FSP39_013361 [Pinctada imbricata]
MEENGLMAEGEEEEGEDEGEWYQNDLQLAAELGKALLERNRELESQLYQLQQMNHEQNMEIEYITKQLETVRDSSESRMRIYEELDRNSQELEKTNQRLMIDSKTDKQRIEKLSSTISSLEDKCEEFQKKIDDMKAEEKRLKQKQQKQDTRRAQSLANLREKEKNAYLKELLIEDFQWSYNDHFKNLPLNPYELEIKKLQETVKQLKAQQMIERRKKEDLETEVTLLWEENDSLEKKIHSMEEQVRENSELRDEIQRVKYNCGKYCKRCSSQFEEIRNAIEKEIEPDEPDVTSGKLARLEGGGSVYGSSESINKIASDNQDVSPSEDVDNSGVSILNELENQYQKLFRKYEDLLQGKGKRSGSMAEPGETFDEALHRHLAVSHKEVQTLLKLQKPSSDAAVGGATASNDQMNAPPHYKLLFRDIFATLRKSRIDETVEQPGSPPRSPPTSPGDHKDKLLH